MREQSSDLQLVSLSLSSALHLDPHSGNLLLSEVNNGDIVNCSIIDGVCSVLVDGGSWQPHLHCGGTGIVYS